MRSAPASILLITLSFATAGCLLRGKTTTARTPPPAPVPVAKAPPPQEPLSIPQTQVVLPAPQPVDEAALATAQEPTVVALPEPPATRPSRRIPAAGVPNIPKPEVPSPAPAAAAQTPAAAPEQAEERPPVLELIPADEQKRLQDLLAARRREITQNMEQAAARGQSESDKNLMGRIRSFVKLAEEAAGRGDLRQADALAERAQILSRELQSGR